MKKTIYSLFLICGLPVIAGAQSTQNRSSTTATVNVQMQIADFAPEERAKAETEKLSRNLGLDSDQQKKMQEINLQTERELFNIRQAGQNASPERTTLILRNRDSQYKTLLTSDQYTRYEEMSKEK